MKQRYQLLRRHLSEFLRFSLWDQDISRMPGLQGFAFRQLRVAVIFVQGVAQGRILLRASAMTYTSLLTLGPVLVLTLSVIQTFGLVPGVQQRIEHFLVDNLSPGSQEQIRGYLYKFFESARTGAFRGLSLLVLLGGVLGLLGSIEQAFNDIWGVHRGRSLFQRFSTYTTLVFFSPILVGLSLSVTASLETSTLRMWIESLSPGMSQLSHLGFKLAPVIFTGIALTLLYTIMPNVRVSLRASLPAGLVAGALWEISKAGYSSYLKSASHYGTLYGSLAAIPLFLIWVHLSWLVVLFGAQLAFARDAAHDFRAEEAALRASQRQRLNVALHVALATARSYRDELGPPDLVGLAHRLELPLRLVRSVAETLVDGGILHLVAPEPRDPGLIPARTPERITVYDVIECLMNRGNPSRVSPEALHGPRAVVEDLMRELNEHLEGKWGRVTLADLLEDQDERMAKEILPLPLLLKHMPVPTRPPDEPGGGV